MISTQESFKFFHYEKRFSNTNSTVEDAVIARLKQPIDAVSKKVKRKLREKSISDFDADLPYPVEGFFNLSLQTHLGLLYEIGVIEVLNDKNIHYQNSKSYMEGKGILGVDVIIRDKKNVWICQIKSSPNWKNSGSGRDLKLNFKKCLPRIRKLFPNCNYQCIELVAKHNGKNLKNGQKSLGQFLTELTGDPALVDFSNWVSRLIRDKFQTPDFKDLVDRINAELEHFVR